jgi:hypothetical protein
MFVALCRSVYSNTVFWVVTLRILLKKYRLLEERAASISYTRDGESSFLRNVRKHTELRVRTFYITQHGLGFVSRHWNGLSPTTSVFRSHCLSRKGTIFISINLPSRPCRLNKLINLTKSTKKNTILYSHCRDKFKSRVRVYSRLQKRKKQFVAMYFL